MLDRNTVIINNNRTKNYVPTTREASHDLVSGIRGIELLTKKDELRLGRIIRRVESRVGRFARGKRVKIKPNGFLLTEHSAAVSDRMWFNPAVIGRLRVAYDSYMTRATVPHHLRHTNRTPGQLMQFADEFLPTIELEDIHAADGDYETIVRRCYKRTIAYHKAAHELIQANYRFVISLATRYSKEVDRDGANDPSDLIMQGMEGLVLAVHKFDPSKNYRFTTYGFWWIKQAVTRYLSTSCRTITVPPYAMDKLHRLNQYMREVYAEQQHPPSDMQCANYLEMKLPEYLMFRCQLEPAVSYDSIMTDAGSALIECLSDGSGDNEVNDNMFAHEIIDRLPHILTPRQLMVIRHIYGIDGYAVLKLGEIEKRLSVSRKTVEICRDQALERVRECHNNTMAAVCNAPPVNCVKHLPLPGLKQSTPG